MIVQHHWTILHNNAMEHGAMSEVATMNTTNWQTSAHELQRIQASRAELLERIMRTVREDWKIEPLPGLRLHRASVPTELGHGVSVPAFCVIAQGAISILRAEGASVSWQVGHTVTDPG